MEAAEDAPARILTRRITVFRAEEGPGGPYRRSDETHTQRLYPREEGYRFFLVACPPGREGDVKDLLLTALASRGLTLETSTARLDRYLAMAAEAMRNRD